MLKMIMRNYILVFVFISWVSICRADSDHAQSLLKPIPKEVMVNEVVDIKPISNHHINMAAPHSCGSQKTVEVSARLMSCQFKKGGDEEIQVGICDDKETFCKVEKFLIHVQVGGQAVSTPTSKIQNKKAIIQPIEVVHGFTNDLPGSIEKAKKEKKFLLVDVYGIWCPPCHELEEYVFGDPAFIEATKDFVKIRIDADTQNSWDWKERYKVKGLPTLMVVDPVTLEEIDRTVGFHQTKTNILWLNNLKEFNGKSIQWALQQKTEEAKMRVAKWHLNRDEGEQALSVIENLNSADANFLRTLISKDLAKDKEDQKTYILLLKDLIQKYPENIRMGIWVSDLLEADVQQGKPYVEQALKYLESWRKSPDLVGVSDIDLDQADLFTIEGDIQGYLGNEAQKKDLYLKAAEYLEEQIKNSNLKLAQGSNLRRGWMLKEAGLPKEAESVFKNLADVYPDQFVFNYRYGYALYDLEKYKEALTYADKAEKQGYGDNFLNLISLKAKILIKLKRNKEAKSLIENTLSRTVIPESPTMSTQYRVQGLRKILLEIKDEPKH